MTERGKGADVLVVGTGLTGLTLAGLLRAIGVTVRSPAGRGSTSNR